MYYSYLTLLAHVYRTLRRVRKVKNTASSSTVNSGSEGSAPNTPKRSVSLTSDKLRASISSSALSSLLGVGDGGVVKSRGTSPRRSVHSRESSLDNTHSSPKRNGALYEMLLFMQFYSFTSASEVR